MDSARPTIEELVTAYHRDVFALAYRLCGSVADAEDLCQQTFLTAQVRLDQLRDPRAARAWLWSIARRQFLAERRRRQPEPSPDLERLAAPLEEGLGDFPIDGETLQQVLGELPDEFRVVLVMFYFEQANYREIAEALELPIGTVMSRLARAKQRLRSRLHDAAAAPVGERNVAHPWKGAP